MTAEEIARKAHASQSYAGVCYADGHLAGVAQRARWQSPLSRIEIGPLLQVAWLHDVLEDTDWTAENLRAAGISEQVVEAVSLLSHDPSEPYEKYIGDLVASQNLLALEVKRADLEFNIIQAGMPGEENQRFQKRADECWLPALGKVLQALGHV